MRRASFLGPPNPHWGALHPRSRVRPLGGGFAIRATHRRFLHVCFVIAAFDCVASGSHEGSASYLVDICLSVWPVTCAMHACGSGGTCSYLCSFAQPPPAILQVAEQFLHHPCREMSSRSWSVAVALPRPPHLNIGRVHLAWNGSGGTVFAPPRPSRGMPLLPQSLCINVKMGGMGGGTLFDRTSRMRDPG